MDGETQAKLRALYREASKTGFPVPEWKMEDVLMNWKTFSYEWWKIEKRHDQERKP